MGTSIDRARPRVAALVLGIACLFALATPGLASASGSATIEGKVTETGTGTAVAGIEVCAYPDTGEEPPTPEQLASLRCVTTGSGGEYVLKEMAPGPYFVSFEVPEGSSLNYVSQQYGGEPPAPVVLVEGQLVKGIDAQLAHGGTITGVVTSASTGAPIEHGLVCASEYENGKPVFFTCAPTGASGAYTLSGLPAGSYKVLFLGPGYEPQLYKDSSTLAGAETVTVEVLKTVGPIDAALAAASATPPPGGETGGGTSKAPGGEPLTGPGAHSHGAGGGDVPPLTLAARRVRMGRHGFALVRLRCAASSACSGRITITVQETVRVHGHERREAVTIATGPVLALGARARTTAHLRLNARGRALLASHGGRLAAILLLIAPGHRQRVSIELQG